MKQEITRENNFDLLRLVAALQVLLAHVFSHFEVNSGWFGQLLDHIPGVPIFFTISGFLIMRSYEKNRNNNKYLRNRFLRIFPALWICFIFTVVLMITSGVTWHQLCSKAMLFWSACQVTFAQFWTPDILRGWGCGTPNGSLWTIPVELQFYILIPLVFLSFKKIPIIAKLIVLFIFSIVVNIILAPFYHMAPTVIIKLLQVSIFPHLFNFLLGGMIYVLWDKIQNHIEGKGMIWLVILLGYILLFGYGLQWVRISYYPNFFGFIYTTLLSITVISLAFTRKYLAHKILRGNDISYGLYIFHMPVVNFFLQINLKNKLLVLSENISHSCMSGDYSDVLSGGGGGGGVFDWF
jgi:peptidoglycan/LPS O-acetylase OafA/YrhL